MSLGLYFVIRLRRFPLIYYRLSDKTVLHLKSQMRIDLEGVSRFHFMLLYPEFLGASLGLTFDWVL